MAEIITAPELLAEEATKLSAFNGINLGGIKDSLEKMLGLIGRNEMFDQYTKHDINHVNIMLELVNDIIPEKTKGIMTKADWLLIVLSTYFHDLGMLVSKKEYNNRNNNRDFIRFKEEYESKPSNIESLKKLGQEESNRFVYQEYVRKNHGKRIADWLTGENVELYDEKVVEKVKDMINGLQPIFIKDIAVICESHNEDDLYDNDKYPIKQGYGMNKEEKGNVFYAALILRTADMLHITGDRAPSIEYDIISPTNPTSQIEWAKQASVTDISPKEQFNKDGNVDKTIQSDTFSITGYFDNPKGFFPLMDYLNYARKQLQQSYRLNEEMRLKFSMEYEFPWKDIDDSNIKTKDYERRQLSFTIDQQKILDLLVGETLYNNITVSLREIAQNAIDAVKVKKYEQDEKGKNSYEPKVNVKWFPETRQLIVADNGTGMDMDIIQNHLLKVGSSRYTDKDFLKSHPNYYSISRFGIGLLSCFLVAEDVDILTRTDTNGKPLLLKVSKLHGKYLLKHGKEIDSPLDFLDSTQSGTSIMLKIKTDVVDFEPEKILRDWILFPACEFTYTENEKSQIIGYSDTRALIEDVLKSNGLSIDYGYEIVGQNEMGIDLSLLMRKNKFLKERTFVDFSDVFNNASVIPCGISIEGIRIDKNTPGYEQARFVAIANLSGKYAKARPNVARSAIDSQTIGGVMGRIYDIYLREIKKQIDVISKEYSVTWASSEVPYLLSMVVGRDDLINKNEFDESLKKQQYFLVYNNGHSFMSIEEIKNLGHFWTIDSNAYYSAASLVREARTPNQSAMNLLKILYGENCELLDDVDVVLNKRLVGLNNPLNEQIYRDFEITDIRVFENYRALNLKWEKKDSKNPKWFHFDMSFNRHELNSDFSIFIQTNDNEISISPNNYEAIRCEHGLYVLSGSAIHSYIIGIINRLSATDALDLRIIEIICGFINSQFHHKEKDEDLGHSFEEFASRYSYSFYQQLKSRIELDGFINACKNSSFSIYDKNLWYRRSPFRQEFI